jgi:hypothetical protein
VTASAATTMKTTNNENNNNKRIARSVFSDIEDYSYFFFNCFKGLLCLQKKIREEVIQSRTTVIILSIDPLQRGFCH